MTKLPGPGFGAGHTAQYQSLAEALCLSVEALDEDLARLAARGLGIEVASLHMEARFLTIVILAAAVCESAGNTILATVLEPSAFDNIDKRPTVEKWCTRIPAALDAPRPSEDLQNDLKLLFSVRNSIMHAKSTIFSDGETIVHPGNSDCWTYLDESTVRRLALVPSRLAAMIPDTADGIIRIVGFAILQRKPRPRLSVN
jgi:hypothetical protein